MVSLNCSILCHFEKLSTKGITIGKSTQLWPVCLRAHIVLIKLAAGLQVVYDDSNRSILGRFLVARLKVSLKFCEKFLVKEVIAPDFS